MPDSPVTFSEHLDLQDAVQPGLAELLRALAYAVKRIAADLGRAGLAGLTGGVGTTSHQGDEQMKLDMRADEMLTAALIRSRRVCAIGSEEHEAPVPISADVAAGADASYAVLFDPLDGSSNIDAGIATGTIFGVYPRVSPVGGPGTTDDLLQPGSQQVCAGYALYSSVTKLVLALPGRVDGFTLDRELGEFLLSHPRIESPPRGRIYSCNEGHAHKWDPVTKAFVDEKKVGARGRYIGSLVADFHRNLLYGGLFLYPADCTVDPPDCKLRLLYEGNPLTYVAVQSGGAGTTGTTPILDVVPDGLHQRVPLVLGSRDDVADYENAVAGIASS